jgi:predicted HAD superfamily Cof-like phosphohydrolase
MLMQMQQVKDFHRKLDVGRPCRPGDDALLILEEVSLSIQRLSKMLEPLGAIDERFSRMHLIFEEAAELGIELSKGLPLTDTEESYNLEAAMLDGLSDLLYVVLGTAVTFDWPMVNAFAEVHDSNMTKEKQDDDEAGHRVRLKGPNYKAPDLVSVLRAYREHQRLHAECSHNNPLKHSEDDDDALSEGRD